ncbi:MAG: hypothetical protein IKT23_04755 [Clostridia bacterium]|nr:hypothetical protein [Clostridia bacterium]MBR6498978.1 hypothetical protein [Clostridia bacterium]
MKKLLALILALALAAGMYAVFAEGGSDAAQMPPAAEETVTEETGADKNQTAETDESAALKEAWKAYKEAKKSEKLEAFEEELKQLVEAGRLTQEQADLLIKCASEGKLPGWKDRSNEMKGKSSGSGKTSRGRGRPSGSSGNKGSESEKSESADAKGSASGQKRSGGSRSGKNR